MSCYRNNKSTLRLHSDDEHEYIDQKSTICSFSIGATRDIEFCLKSIPGSDPVITFNMTEGSLVLMKPGCQQALKHRVPKRTGKIGMRFSFSFRKLLPSDLNLSPIKRTIAAFKERSRTPGESMQLNAPTKHPCVLHHDADAQGPGVTVLIGDSISEHLVSDKLGKGKTEVVNLSKGGSKIVHVKQQLPIKWIVPVACYIKIIHNKHFNPLI